MGDFGREAWATNCAGWDYGGADLQCVVCRTEKTGPPGASGAIIASHTRGH